MKRLSLALLATAAFVMPAAAADVVMEQPPAPPAAPIEAAPVYDWSGLYVGGQLGAAFNNNNDSGLVFDPDGDGVNNVVDIFNDNNAGFAGGVHVGYDWQVNNWVIGGVADISYLDADVDRSFSDGVDTYGVNQDVNFFGTVRGRLGYAFNRLLVYGTGGLAYANSDTTFTAPAGSAVTFDSNDSDFGYTVGGGIDYLVTDKLSFGVEYLYTDLGSNDFSFSAPGGAGTVNAGGGSDNFDFHTVWAKVSYHF